MNLASVSLRDPDQLVDEESESEFCVRNGECCLTVEIACDSYEGRVPGELNIFCEELERPSLELDEVDEEVDEGI